MFLAAEACSRLCLLLVQLKPCWGPWIHWGHLLSVQLESRLSACRLSSSWWQPVIYNAGAQLVLQVSVVQSHEKTEFDLISILNQDSPPRTSVAASCERCASFWSMLVMYQVGGLAWSGIMPGRTKPPHEAQTR